MDGAVAFAPAAFDTTAATKDYVIGPLDKLSIKVFQSAELSLDGVQVDASGQIVLPLIGDVAVAGKSTDQVSKEIADRLRQRYMQSPEVSVIVQESASQKVTVEGEVKSAGVFKMAGRTTLMEALAMAGGPSDTADLHEVAIIRMINGKRSAALCDFTKIRDGSAPDPEIQGNDVVVMNGSTSKEIWADVLKTAPLFTLLAIAV
jgi:polysaccharide export outer membrane protein